MVFLLHQVLDRAADAAPDKEALRFEGDSITYSELARRCDQTANALDELGVRRGNRVGIFVSKGIEAAIAMYSIWKVGAAHVPIDPWLPPERLAVLLEDCGIRVLFVDSSRLRKLSQAPIGDTCLSHLVGVDQAPQLDADLSTVGWDEISRSPARPPEVVTTEQDLAYIYYTSGSTGDPKGMMHTHRSGLTFVDWTVDEFGLCAEDRVGNHAPLHFDLSLFDYVSTAVVTGTTVIVSEERQKMPASVSGLIESERVTVWYSVPAAWTQMLARGGLQARDLSSLRLVMYAGEPFPPDLLRTVMELVPQAQFCNLYGVTESNVCTHYVVPRPVPEACSEVPIGRLCPNFEGVVIDEDDNVVDEAEIGELVLRGPGVMLGYWNRPGLNQAAFWERPVFGDQRERFYRTGDLVRRGSDGVYHFAGRRDRQIKSRGHRIELDEVQAALASHPTIEEAAVFTVPDGEGSLRVEAAVALCDGAAWNEIEVARRIKERTASYSVPARTVVLSRLPRTSAGKIDFQELRRRSESGELSSSEAPNGART